MILQWQLDRAPADSSLLFDTSTFDSAPICVPGSDSGAGTRRPGRVDTNGDAASVDGAAASPLPETEKAAKDCQEATEAVQSIVASRTMGVHEPQLDGLTPGPSGFQTLRLPVAAARLQCVSVLTCTGTALALHCINRTASCAWRFKRIGFSDASAALSELLAITNAPHVLCETRKILHEPLIADDAAPAATAHTAVAGSPVPAASAATVPTAAGSKRRHRE